MQDRERGGRVTKEIYIYSEKEKYKTELVRV